jgi:hypothetical protein
MRTQKNTLSLRAMIALLLHTQTSGPRMI